MTDDRLRSRRALAAGTAVIVAVLAGSVLTLTHDEPEIGPDHFEPVPTVSTTEPGGLGRASDATTTTATTTAPPGAPLSVLPARTSTVATARTDVESIELFPSSDATRATGSLPAEARYGQRQVLLVLADQGDRLHVLLPERPNGSTAWIDAGTVDLTQHGYQIQVAIGAHQLMLQRGDEVLIDTPIAVGTEDTPTVGGDFYTWVLIDPTNAGYGSYAYGLSGFSTLDDFAGGDGRMAIHGTTDEAGIVGDGSHGCVRVPDAVAVRMVEELRLPLGIPVTIRP